MKKTLVSKDEVNSILCRLKDRIVNVFGEELKMAVLFGSYARGDYDAESDVDLLIVFKTLTPQEEQRLSEIINEFEQEADFAFIISAIKLDEEGYLMRKHKGSLFLDTIEEEGKVFWRST